MGPAGHQTPLSGLDDFAATLARRMSPDSVGYLHPRWFDIDESDFDPAGALVGIHQTGLGEKADQVALLNPSYSWTRKLTTGMGLHAQYQVSRMGRRNFSEAEKAIRRLKETLFDEQKKTPPRPASPPPQEARTRTQDPHRTRPHNTPEPPPTQKQTEALQGHFVARAAPDPKSQRHFGGTSAPDPPPTHPPPKPQRRFRGTSAPEPPRTM